MAKNPRVSTPQGVSPKRLKRFHGLMTRRVRRMLLVASHYDSFILEEDGQLDELILNEFTDVSLRNAPGMQRVSTGREALDFLHNESFDLVVTTGNLGDMPIEAFVQAVQALAPDLPVVLLAFDTRLMMREAASAHPGGVDAAFLWQGDFRILLAIVKFIEDRWNVEKDVQLGVGVILLVEDSVRYYSSFLPMLYTELMKQSQRVISEGLNLTHKVMRLRARPKILLAGSFESAWEVYRKYEASLIGVVSDVDFPWSGHSPSRAGLELTARIRESNPDLPILLQTKDPSYIALARNAKAKCILKDSPVLLQELREFMLENFGFGDFVFRMADGREAARAQDLRELELALAKVPGESVKRHAERNHFSTWLKARTEFSLADHLLQASASEFESEEEIRRFLVRSIQSFRRERQTVGVSRFQIQSFDSEEGFSKIGSGSMGGKARGLAFVRQLIFDYGLRHAVPGITITVPAALVITTDVFDRFMDTGDLRDFALKEHDDRAILDRFVETRFPKAALNRLRRYVEHVDYPLAVRSSSLLEDSQYRPFAGIYKTFMVPNNQPDPRVRLRVLLDAVKAVYASTYSTRTKEYIKNTPYRLEEEKMAVVIQKLVGRDHQERFYPAISGVAQSTNFYPMPPAEREDGEVTLAVGLGETIVEGGKALRFSPQYPRHAFASTDAQAILDTTQREFLALDLGSPSPLAHTKLYPLDAARSDGTLGVSASVYSSQNNAIYPGLGREGIPVITFDPILKHDRIPLCEVVNLLLETGSRGLNTPAVIEFAVDFDGDLDPEGQINFSCLQMRPLVLHQENKKVRIADHDQESALCFSRRVLGHGELDGISDLVVVDRDKFDRAKSRQVKSEVSQFNRSLLNEKRPYILIGVGRWGASDPWLGVPVAWEDIHGAKVVVECGFREFCVAPSQGSHFFQNLIAASIGYFSVGFEQGDGHVDWDWLRSQKALAEGEFTRHLRLDRELTVTMAGDQGLGLIR